VSPLRPQRDCSDHRWPCSSMRPSSWLSQVDIPVPRCVDVDSLSPASISSGHAHSDVSFVYFARLFVLSSRCHFFYFCFIIYFSSFLRKLCSFLDFFSFNRMPPYASLIDALMVCFLPSLVTDAIMEGSRFEFKVLADSIVVEGSNTSKAQTSSKAQTFNFIQCMRREAVPEMTGVCCRA
jgi:hypothetical protein